MSVEKFSGVRLILSIFTVCVFLQLVIPQLSQALYRYKDGSGNLCFTDDWRNIPAAFRASAEPPVPPANAVPVPPPATAAPSGSSMQVPAPQELQPSVAPPATAAPVTWAKLGAYLGAAVAGLFLLGRLLRHIASPMLGRLILLACFLGVLTYGYKLYVDNMVDGYFALKQQSLKLMDKALKREPPPVPEGQQ